MPTDGSGCIGERSKMNHGSLFSGIGGFELAAEWMGWDNLFHCEFNEFGSKVLNHYWPESKHYGDITKSDFFGFRDRIDILTGGFPCQPYSAAGKRQGKDDARHLWPEMLRVIREVRPRYIVGENVYGLVTWNGGVVFDEVCTDLEVEGYAVWPIVIPAAAVNAPHRRDRVWFVAKNTKCNGCVFREPNQEGSEIRQFGNTCTGNPDGVYISERLTTYSDNIGHRGRVCEQCADREWELLQNECKRSEMGCEIEGCCRVGDVTNANNQSIHFKKVTIEHTNGFGQKRRLHKNKSKTSIREQFGQRDARSFESTTWQNFPSQSPICSGDDGLPTKLDGITFPKWRNESIKAYGNAIVPQVAYQIFKAIDRLEKVR